MCGVAGSILRRGRPTAVEYGQVLNSMRHRGPDSEGAELLAVGAASVELLHTRLSIVDLSPGGHQPMFSPDRRCCIVLNGEIYNYRELRTELAAGGRTFTSDSDTEVLLAAWEAWGTSCLERLVGMFAFAVVDSVDQTLTLVRDAFGIKPLYYCQHEGALHFASEIAALVKLMGHQPDPDVQRVYEYLVWGRYDYDEQTFLSGVRHLLPGHLMTVDLRTFRSEVPRRWWWPSIEERADLSFDEASEQLRELFLNSVRLHLRSDVPVGAALSGGLDSSAIVCAMRHLEPDMPIHTFTYVARGSSKDEEAWADIVNDHVGAISHKVLIEPQDLTQDLDALIRCQGEPFGGTSIYAQHRVYRAASEAGIKVMLDGQGADELFADYEGYPEFVLRSMRERRRYLDAVRYLRAWSNKPGASKLGVCRPLAHSILESRARKLVRSAAGLRNPARNWLDPAKLVELDISTAPPAGPRKSKDARKRRLVEQLRHELTLDRIPRLLRYADRNAMHHSIENRVPFLTTELVNFALSLPERYLAPLNAETKGIF